MEIADSVLDLIGNTPLVRLRHVTEQIDCAVVAKLETTNPGGSAKDRPALAMIDAAERDGSLRPGGTIVEPTSGNTGVGLAIVAAQRGYRCVFVLNDKVAPEKVDLLQAYGAEVVVCPTAVPPTDPDSYYSTAARLAAEIPDAFRPDQYSNPANPGAHSATTGPEIWRQTGGRVTHFVAGAGTGGTLSGVGSYLKSKNPAVQVVAADPEGSVYSGGSGRPYLVEGIGEDFWPATYDRSVIDRVVAVSDRDSFLAARQVTRREGLLIGGSGGSAVAASLTVAAELGPDDLVVVLIPDSGRGYLSRVFNDEWLAGYGFLTADGPVVANVISAREASADVASGDAGSDANGAGRHPVVPSLVYVQPDDRVRDAIDALQRHDISQLPVAMGKMPLAAAEVMGSVNELRLMESAWSDPSALDRPVRDVMSPPMQTVGAGQPVELAVRLLDLAPALLVLDGGRPQTVLARSDLLRFLSLDPADACPTSPI